VRTLLYEWIKINSLILLNAGSLVATFAVTSGFGFVYWWLAARLFPPEAVGFASAAISAMLLLGTICILGLGTLLIRELPRQRGKEASLISAALILVGGVGGCVGLLFAVVAPYISADLQPLRASIQNVALFAVAVSLTAITMVLDQAVIGLLRSDLKLWRNALFSGAKLVALFVASLWLSQRVGLTIYATWVIGDSLSLAALAGFAVLKGKWTGRISLPDWRLLRELGRSTLQHHILNLILQGPAIAMPVLVTVLVSATMNAWFYVSFTLADIVYIVPYALVTTLYAVSSAQPSVLAHKARLTIGLAVITCVLANCVLLFGSKQLLGLFGQSYVEEGVWCLRILGLGALPFIIKEHYLAICRIQDRIANALLPLTVAALLELAAAGLGAHLAGLPGLSFGWITVECVETIFMFRIVYKTVRNINTLTSKNQLQTFGDKT